MLRQGTVGIGTGVRFVADACALSAERNAEAGATIGFQTRPARLEALTKTIKLSRAKNASGTDREGMNAISRKNTGMQQGLSPR